MVASGGSFQNLLRSSLVCLLKFIGKQQGFAPFVGAAAAGETMWRQQNLLPAGPKCSVVLFLWLQETSVFKKSG